MSKEIHTLAADLRGWLVQHGATLIVEEDVILIVHEDEWVYLLDEEGEL